MSRRESRKQIPESLKETQSLTSQLENRATSAENRLSVATNAIKAAESQKAEVEKSLESLEKTKAQKLEEHKELDQLTSEKQDTLRELEGKLVTEQGTLDALADAIKLLKRENEKDLATMRENHSSQMTVFSKASELANTARKEAETNLAKKKVELVDTEKLVTKLTLEVSRLEKTVLPALSGKEEELGTLNHQLLVKQNEVLDAEAQHTAMVGKYHDEKVRYEEAKALRLSEENRVEAELAKLIDKEREVESKMRSLRNIQKGVDQATSRLERKEKDVELKNHLAKPRQVIQT